MYVCVCVFGFYFYTLFSPTGLPKKRLIKQLAEKRLENR